MRAYNFFTLIAAVIITVLEVLLFTRASEIAPRVETQRVVGATQSASAIAPWTDPTCDVGSVSGE